MITEVEVTDLDRLNELLARGWQVWKREGTKMIMVAVYLSGPQEECGCDLCVEGAELELMPYPVAIA